MYPTTEQEALATLNGADPELAATAEAILWSIWCRCGNNAVEDLLRAGIEAMNNRRLADAEQLFTQVVGALPGFAEGWNKRATVRYLRKNFPAAIADCRETLARNPNHFGAASGQGLCHMALGEYREAAVCFRRALEIHPHLHAARHNLALAQAHGGGTGYVH
jgi:tetratricopeptide (TPR) repeat protein